MTTKQKPPPVSLNVARGLMEKGKPWCFRIINTNLNESSKTGSPHNKFWEATGTGKWDDVTIRHGARGTLGSTLTKNWPYVEDKAPRKLRKGYRADLEEVNQAGYDDWYAEAFLETLDFPYSLITTYKPVGNHFDCFDGDSKLVVTITAKGVKQLQLEQRPDIKLQGSGS